MTKFKRVLSESDADLMVTHLANEIGFDNVTPELIRIFCLGVDWAEQAVLAELAEQEPVAWFTEDHLTDRSATAYDPVVRDRWIAKGWPISLLYTHPCDSQIPDGTLTDEGTKTKPVLTTDEKDFERAIGLYVDNIKDWQLVPREPTENQIDSAMEASLRGGQASMMRRM